MISSCYSGVYDGFVKDKRLRKRIESTLYNLITQGSCIINKSVPSHTDKIGTYRMLSNERFDFEDLLNATHNKCAQSIDVKHVLAIQDTTEFNYQGIKEKLGKEDKDIGPTSIDSIAGYFCHPMLVVNPNNNNIYGLASTLIYNRDWNKLKKHERKYPQQPIEEKESYRWLRSAELSKQIIPNHVQLTIVGDRESDIYDEFYRVPDERTNLLVRSRCDRYLVNSNSKLYEYLSNQPVAGTYEIELSSNTKRSKRVTQIEIRFCCVEIEAPKKHKHKHQSVKLTAIEAREIGQNNSDKLADEPVLWRLLTTHQVDNYDQVVECINWYKKRWLIEELFRVLKTKGFCIESSQLSSGSKLKKLLALTLEAALHVMRLKLSLTQEEQEAESFFTDEEQDFLEVLQSTVEGATQKQKNPYPNRSLAWAAWTIARVAGWSGYKSHGPPGYITIKEGYDRFNAQLQIYLLMKKPR